MSKINFQICTNNEAAKLATITFFNQGHRETVQGTPESPIFPALNSTCVVHYFSDTI